MKQSNRDFLIALILIAPHVSAWLAVPVAAFFIAVALGSGDQE